MEVMYIESILIPLNKYFTSPLQSTSKIGKFK